MVIKIVEQKKKEFKIKFYGESTVRAYTENEAKAKTESSIPKNKGYVRTESDWFWVGKSILINLGVIITYFAMIITLKLWAELLIKVNSMYIPYNLNFIIIMILCIFMINTIRFPKVLGGWFDKYGDVPWQK